MIINELRFYKYCLPLIKPLYVRGKCISAKEGVLVELLSQSGVSGFGEISPLPNLHKETLDDCTEECLILKEGFPGNDLPDNAHGLDGVIGEYFTEYPLKPTVRFGIEMALLHLIANMKKKPLRKILPGPSRDFVHLNYLLIGDKDSVLQEADIAMKAGSRSFKLKGSDDINQDIEKVLALNKLFNGKALLHIDANQKWTLEKALLFAEKTGFWAVEYIEEPFKDIKKIAPFIEKTTIPVALDESTENNTLEELNHIDGVDVFVLKPNLIGSLETAWQHMLFTQSMAIRPVISSCYESSLGIYTLASLASCLAHESFTGLDTLKFFEKDILKEPLKIERGKLQLESRNITADDIDFSLCEEL